MSIVATEDGAEPDVNGEFTVTLSEAVSSDTVISYSVGGSATAGDDYTGLSGTVTILANQTSATIVVPVLDDLEVELDESVIVTLDAITSGDPSVVLGTTDTATMTIVDNEVANEVSLVAYDGCSCSCEWCTTASEPETNGHFTVNLSSVSAIDTIISYSVDGTATANSDYTALSGEVTIPAGQTFATIVVEVLDDQLEEGPESVIVTLDEITSADANVMFGAATEATVTINDDDQPLSTITIEAEDIDVVTGYRVENNAAAFGGAMLSFRGAPGNETGSASFGFTGASGTYNVVLGVFDENDGAPAASLEVSVDGSSIGTVVLDQDPGGSGANANTQVERSVATVTINAGDTITVTGVESGNEHARFDFIRFEPVGPAIPEVSIVATEDGAEPTVAGEFTVTLSEAVSSDTVIGYSVGGSATAGDDYAALSGTVTILANQTSATIVVPVLDDLEVESDESVIVTLDAITSGDPNVVLGATDTATVTIADNEVTNEVNVAATIAAASEPGTDGEFTVSLGAPATTDTVISYSVSGSATAGDDYTTLSGEVTILGGQPSATIALPVLDDLEVESDESVIVTLDAITSGDPNVVLGATDTATVTIADNEVANEVNVAVTIAAASEPGTDGEFTVSLGVPATTDTVISYSVSGSATAGSDYTTLSGEVTILGGQISATIAVPVLDDQLEESQESVIITLDAITAGDANVVLGTSTEATVTISDNDQSLSPITIEAEDIADVTNYRIENNNVASGGSMLSFRGAPGNETGSASFDFTGASGTYNVVLGAFDENDGAPAASLEVSVDGSSIGTVVLDQDPGGAGAAANTQVERSVATVSINAGDTITVTGVESGNEHARFDFIRFEPVGPAIPEVSIVATEDGAEPTVTGEFTITLSEAVSSDTVISYSVGGSATAGDDYAALSGTVTILANQTSATIVVPVLDDLEVESDESVIVTLDAITSGDPNVVLGATDTATVTIADNEVTNEVNVAATIAAASEPGTDGEFTVSLGAPATTDTVISYSVSGSATAGSDYTALSGEVTILGGQTSATIAVPVLDDQLEEGQESVVVTLNTITAGDSNVVLGTSTEATVTISDDDQPLSVITIEAEDVADVTNYRIENSSVASGGSMLSFRGAPSDEIGSVNLAVDSLTGVVLGQAYDIQLGTFDENDGEASFTLDLNNLQIGQVVLNDQLGSSLANANTQVTLGIASNVILQSGDVLTITGNENLNEHARLDFIEFSPVLL